ncbi:MAG TPA: CopD family protein [Edaphocola sp.]|nr:CopD family protein [Edaphocola sp.]
MYSYLLALHIIFIVTWFSGLFYIVRLFIYAVEAHEKKKPEMVAQLNIMAKRLWLGITWPSAILTAVFGPLVMWKGGWLDSFGQQDWLHVKLGFVILLYFYFYSLHRIYKQQQKGIFRISSQKLRIWNEVATVFLIAIVMLAVVKNALSWLWGLLGLAGVVVLLLAAIKIYKNARKS